MSKLDQIDKKTKVQRGGLRGDKEGNKIQQK